MKGRGRRIVVDADVGRAAANIDRADRGEQVDARAFAFARCLQAFYNARHVAVFSPSLMKEWRKHARKGSSGHRWLIRMLERRLVHNETSEPDSIWIEELISKHLPDGDANVASKDRHLVAVAIAAADRRILSGDGKAREKFVRLVDHVDELDSLHWADPGWDSVPHWLLDKAPDHEPWTLGAR